LGEVVVIHGFSVLVSQQNAQRERKIFSLSHMGCASSRSEETEDCFVLPPSLANAGARRNRELLLDILKHPQLCLLFREFCRSIFSLDSFMFFLEVEDYKMTFSNLDSVEVSKRAEKIYHDYFTPDSETEIDIEGSIREMLKENIKLPTKDTFDLVQQLVLLTLECDCLPKFIACELFQDFISDATTRKVFLQGIKRTTSTINIEKYCSSQAA